MARNKTKIINPGAAVVIYNYSDRLGTKKTPGVQSNATEDIDQIILNTASLISISTSKSKGAPNGNFEIVLAPWKNWVTAITPGSWCVILMGRSDITDRETKYNNPKVDKRHFKMLGRIESVRAVTSVDQQTGALNTSYIVTGSDWGTVFNSFLYVDPVARTRMEQGDNSSSVGAANRLIYSLLNTTDGETKTEIALRDSTVAVQGLMAFWGASSELSSATRNATDGKLLAKAENAFTLPEKLSKYMGFTDLSGKATQKLADILRTRCGVLKAYDTYSAKDNIEDKEHSDGLGYIDPASIFGMHSVWQIMMDNCNAPLNEMLTDIRWEDGKPLLTLYKRVKPFKIRDIKEIVGGGAYSTQDGGSAVAADFLEKIASDFRHVKRHYIAPEDVLSVNAGTNWRDRFNFIEVLLGKNIIPRFNGKELFSTAAKLQSQYYDHPSIRRDGFTPMTMTINYLPASEEAGKAKYDLEKVYAYKYLGKEWFFDTHKMLNGSISFVGMDDYIQVGDNIMFDSSILSSSHNVNSDTLNGKDKTYITAHVETISHRATVSPDGARSFVTDIQFVRGIVTNNEGEAISSKAEQTLDQDATKIGEYTERNRDRVMGTSSRKDPDTTMDKKKE